MDNTLYIKMRHRVQVEPNAVVNLGQLALLISEESIEKELAQLSVYKVKKSDRNITIIDLMKVIALIKKACPHLDVQTIGPAQTIVEVVYKKTIVFYRIYSCLVSIVYWCGHGRHEFS